MFDLLENKEKHCEFEGAEAIENISGRYCYIPGTYKVTLGEIVDLLMQFKEQSKTLSPKDFKLFYLLSEQLNQPVSREKLFHEIWDGQEVHDSLNNSISRLRKLLEKDTTLSIDAVKGVGYILSKKDQLSSS